MATKAWGSGAKKEFVFTNGPPYDMTAPNGAAPAAFSVHVSDDYPALSQLNIANYTVGYAASTGTSGNSGTEASPWDITTALNNLDSGTIDWLYIKDTVTMSIVHVLSSASGTAGHPIVITGLNGNGGIDSTSGGGIDFDGVARWLVEDLTVDTNASAFGLLKNTLTSYVTIRNVVGTMTTGGDNVGFITADAGTLTAKVDYLGVFDCNITGPGSSVHGNTACIYNTRVPHVRIENNILDNAPQPIYFKHVDHSTAVTGGQIFRYNWVKGTTGTCRFAMKEGIIAHNIFERTVRVENGGGGNLSENNTVEHNTVPGFSIFFGGNGGGNSENNTIKNNVMTGYAYSGTAPLINTSDYNLLESSGGTLTYGATSGLDLAGWRTNAGADNPSIDANSIEGAPTFSGGASPSTVAGFALADGSNGKNAADDGTDMGVDTNKCGRKAA